jgi:hypothetical protein
MKKLNFLINKTESFKCEVGIQFNVKIFSSARNAYFESADFPLNSFGFIKIEKNFSQSFKPLSYLLNCFDIYT